MDSTGTRTGDRQAREADREWSGAALAESAERADAEAVEASGWGEPEPVSRMATGRAIPSPSRAIVAIGLLTLVPWLVLGAVAYLVYVLLD